MLNRLVSILLPLLLHFVVLMTGISNSYGAWITPGFQLHLSKVDQVSPKPPAVLAGMRFPVALAQHKPPQQLLQDQQAAEQQQPQGAGQEQREAVFDFLPDVTDL